MKSIRNIAFSVLLTVGAFGAVTYTACNKDECKDVVCENGGTCIGGSCSCPTGYEGSRCQDLTVTRFIGSWTGQDQCTSGDYTITLTVGASSSNEISALVSNPGGFGGSVVITGTVSGNNSLSFSNESVGGGRTLTGTMTFNGSSMQFEYSVTPASGSVDHCTGTYTEL
jgi:hypothetical protein